MPKWSSGWNTDLSPRAKSLVKNLPGPNVSLRRGEENVLLDIVSQRSSILEVGIAKPRKAIHLNRKLICHLTTSSYFIFLLHLKEVFLYWSGFPGMMQTRSTINSEWSSCLCLWSAGVTDMCHHTWLHSNFKMWLHRGLPGANIKCYMLNIKRVNNSIKMLYSTKNKGTNRK